MRPDLEFFQSGHWCASYNGSPPDDADFLPDLIEGTDSLDSNGSEALYIYEDADKQIHVLFAVYGRHTEDNEQVYELIGVPTLQTEEEFDDWYYLTVTSATLRTETPEQIMEMGRAGKFPPHIDY